MDSCQTKPEEYFDLSNNFVYFGEMTQIRWILLLGVFLIVSCFGRDYRGGIMRYEKGRIFTGTKVFQVTYPPPPWQDPRLHYKEMIHENDRIQGTIVTDALCGPKFEDTPLAMLAKHLFYKLENPHMEPHRYFELEGREAIHVEGKGSMDGIPLRMAVVVLKKNACIYDFVYFAPPDRFREGVKDFENYYRSLKTP